jgi:hypothetical protein
MLTASLSAVCLAASLWLIVAAVKMLVKLAKRKK